MQHIHVSLQELDQLYHQDSIGLYETHWQETAKLIQQSFPGFTIAYAELYNSGSSRLAGGAMHHVLVPLQRSYLFLKPEM